MDGSSNLIFVSPNWIAQAYGFRKTFVYTSVRLMNTYRRSTALLTNVKCMTF